MYADDQVDARLGSVEPSPLAAAGISPQTLFDLYAALNVTKHLDLLYIHQWLRWAGCRFFFLLPNDCEASLVRKSQI